MPDWLLFLCIFGGVIGWVEGREARRHNRHLDTEGWRLCPDCLTNLHQALLARGAQPFEEDDAATVRRLLRELEGR